MPYYSIIFNWVNLLLSNDHLRNLRKTSRSIIQVLNWNSWGMTQHLPPPCSFRSLRICFVSSEVTNFDPLQTQHQPSKWPSKWQEIEAWSPELRFEDGIRCPFFSRGVSQRIGNHIYKLLWSDFWPQIISISLSFKITLFLSILSCTHFYHFRHAHLSVFSLLGGIPNLFASVMLSTQHMIWIQKWLN